MQVILNVFSSFFQLLETIVKKLFSTGYTRFDNLFIVLVALVLYQSTPVLLQMSLIFTWLIYSCYKLYKNGNIPQAEDIKTPIALFVALIVVTFFPSIIVLASLFGLTIYFIFKLVKSPQPLIKSAV